MDKIEVERNKWLVECYPFIYDGRENYDFSWTWFDFMPERFKPRFKRMCDEIKKYCDSYLIKDFYIVEVKEKYGECRIYCNSYWKDIQDIIDFYWSGIKYCG